MNTRTIDYIDEQEDLMELELDQALSNTMEQNLKLYFASIAAQCAIMGVDIRKPSNSRKIYFIDELE
ncbi:hypothetical protein [Ekhidna sp.]